MANEDQRNYWNNTHRNRALNKYSTKPTDFAERVVSFFPSHAKILELGCGLGNDSVFFAKKGYDILATDFSEIVIEENRNSYNYKNLRFETLDIKSITSFTDSIFDVVYARLSLHYFTNFETRKIFKELYRILKDNGLVCFACKSVDDPLYGKGRMIEKDMFDDDGHVRHFFSKEYINELLEPIFKIKSLQSKEENLYGHKSAFIEVIAQKQRL